MKTNFIFLCAAILFFWGSPSSGQLLGSSKCSWGPGYWCSGFDKARECSATTHCIQNYWSQLELPPDDDEVCAVCKEMVAEARDTLQSNETREELKEVFEGSCKLIPIKAIADECIAIFDDFVPELVEALASEMNPQIVCATAGLCNSERIDRLLQKLYAKSTNTNSMCQTCRSGVQKLNNHLRQTNPQALQMRLMDMCGEFSSYSDACKVTVSESFNDIYGVLKNNLNDEICDLTGICSETFQTELVDANPSEDIQCEFCEKVIQHWKDEWTSRTTIEEFKEVLDALCHKLHSTDRVNRCLHIVDDYYVPMFNFIAHELEPKMICQIFGLCPHATNNFFKITDDSSVFTLLLPEGSNDPIFQTEVQPIRSNNLVDSTPTFDASNGLEDEEYPYIPYHTANRVVPETPLVSIFASSQDELIEASSIYEDGRPLIELESSIVLQVPTEDSSIGCSLCKEVITALKAKVTNNTEEEIREKLETMCLAFPQIVRSQCKEFVDKYTDQIINGVIRNMTAEEICYQIHFCSKPKEIVMAPPVKSIQCSICKKVIKVLEHEIKNKKSEAEIRRAIGQLCKKFPFPLRRTCKKFVGKYTDALVKAILKGMKPDQICHKIHVCMVKKIPEKRTVKCKVCKKAVKILNSEIKNKTNDDEIKKALSTLCTKFPKGLTRQCRRLVAKYSKELTQGIKKGLGPIKLCEDLQLCQADLIPIQAVSPVDNTAGCTLCEYIIKELDVYLNQKGNRDSIEHALDSVCHMMSSPSSQRKCQEFVDTYINMILDTFTHGMSPKELCQLIYICQNDDFQTRELGFKSENQCKICDGIFTEIYEDVLDQEEEIKEALRNVCYAVLTGSDVDSCKTMVDTYVSMVISNIMTHDSPEAFCRNFYQCEDEPTESLTPLLHPNEIPPLEMVLSQEYSSGRFCKDCMKVINEMENSALTNTSIDFTVRALQMVCSTFPTPVDTKCEEAIDEIDGDIEGFLSDHPPKSVCKYLRLCPANLYDSNLKLWDASVVGGTKCIWGPEYWCQSLIHARSCGTIDHCKKNAWL